MRGLRFKLKIFFWSLYLSIVLRRLVRINWRVANLVIEKGGYCPCRFERSWRTKCPCVWHVEELKRFGRCKCGLFYVYRVSKRATR